MSLYIRGDFHVCPDPLSLDPYNTCEWSCCYCFIKQMEQGILKSKVKEGLKPNDAANLEKVCHSAFDTRRESRNPTVLALRAKLPVIIGRKCDPFCPSESKFKATEKVLEVLDRYGVTSVIETKGVEGVEDAVTKRSKVGVLVSIMPGSESIHDSLEPGTPGFEDRFELARSLKNRGIWVGLIAEPIIPSVNDRQDYFERYADMASELGADHVNFGGLRVSNPKFAYASLKSAGFDLVEILKAKEKGWRDIGDRFFSTLKSRGLKVSSPDWDLFHAQNSCEGCCGLDQFGLHHFTFQKACEVLKEKGRVRWQEVASHNIFGEKYLSKFREIWDGKRGYYNLTDVKGIHVVGHDENGDVIYGKGRSLAEAFG